MPIHDWTRVRANRFHDFHQSWTVAISTLLNHQLLPEGYFSLIEQTTSVAGVGLTPLKPSASEKRSHLKDEPIPLPQTRFVTRASATRYAQRGNRVVIRHPDGDVVAVIEIVSPGNKSSRDALNTFTRKAVRYLRAGIHLLIVDLFPPSRRDPQGIHKAIWDRIEEQPFELPADKPLTLASYVGDNEIVGYIEPVAVGDMLPEMPVFLEADYHIFCPLESTYQTAWEQFPAVLKAPLEDVTSG